VISAQDRPAFRAYFTVVSSVWSHVWRTCCIALRVAATSAVQLCGLDLDAPGDRGSFIALWTVVPPLYLAMATVAGGLRSISRLTICCQRNRLAAW
jgi:hypothetical protein